MTVAPHPTRFAPSLQDVLDRLATAELPPTRRRDLSSAVRRLAALLGKEPAQIVADVRTIGRILATTAPAAHGIADKTLANLRANLAAALRAADVKMITNTAQVRLSPVWRGLATPRDKRMGNGLSRFMRCCDAAGVAPQQVDDVVFDRFAEAVRNASFIAKPHDVVRRVARLWNEAADVVPGWPQNRLIVPSFRAPARTPPLDAYPASFQAEVAAHLDWLAGADPLADNPPPRPSRPGTVRLRRTHLLLAAAALARRGRDPQSIVGLADLTTPAAVKEIARDYLERNDGKPTQFARDLVKALRLVARGWLRLDEAQLAPLRDIQRRLCPDRSGLTPKNRETLRALDDPAALGRLLQLPRSLMAEAVAADRDDSRSAIRAQVAAVFAILLAAPLRMQNLASLALEVNLHPPARRGGPWVIALHEDETKTGEPLEYEIGGEAGRVLAAYVDRFRPRLPGAEGPCLFPAAGGSGKAQETLRQQFTAATRRKIGVRLTPHQLRHVSAKLILTQAPGNYELVRQLLGHRNLKTTTSFYTGLQTRAAARAYDDLMTRLKDELPPSGGGRRRR